MPPSQLKQLKASLREHGVLGPQKSKKQKKSNAKDGQKRFQRNLALESIREKFNPFEAKAPARRDKFDVVTNKVSKSSVERPGVTRGLGEERRRDTLLKEMRSKNKVGGMMDRRFGEDDPTMTPEQKAAERFAQQAMRMSKKNLMFNLENDSDEELQLTHGGRALELDSQLRDDFNEDFSSSEEQDFEGEDHRPRKRLRIEDPTDEGEDDEPNQDTIQKKKSKNEVMKEVIAKSKMYKAARQAAKEDDEDLRAQLDADVGTLFSAFTTRQISEKQLPSPPGTDSEPAMDPSRAAILAGKSREEAEKEYEANLRQLKMDARSKPTVRTKTDEEKAHEEKERLEELERKRVQRMRGEIESSNEQDESEDDRNAEESTEDELPDDAEAFGLTQPATSYRPQLDVEDEDEFVLDDIVDSESDNDLETDEETESGASIDVQDDGDDDFINGLVLPKYQLTLATKKVATSKMEASERLAYTFTCPQSHQDLLEIVQNTPTADIPVIIQRIRALYHKGLAEGNQAKLGRFAQVLVEHLTYIADNDAEVSVSVLEQLLRHLHSMAKDHPQDVALAARTHLKQIAAERPSSLTFGDAILLTGVATMFPTSDQWHSVVSPAMLTLARYLGQSAILDLHDLVMGAYCCTLALQYQSRSYRYVPEVITYIGNALYVLAPAISGGDISQGIPRQEPNQSLRITTPATRPLPKLSVGCLRGTTSIEAESLLYCFLNLAKECVDIWASKSAIPELLEPLLIETNNLVFNVHNAKSLSESTISLSRSVHKLLDETVSRSIDTRKPLLHHKHRPLAIKSSYPAFIENYNPDRHYDPDRERAELSKLKAEHKKERKGAMRELRKDANFIARERLREKKARDEAYEKKFKRLVAEIQGEEGREAKEYEKERRKRQRKS